MDTVKVDVSNDMERIFASCCLKNYEEFKKYYEQLMDPTTFVVTVDKGVNSFADKRGYSCIADADKFEETFRIVSDVCNEAYYTVYWK